MKNSRRIMLIGSIAVGLAIAGTITLNTITKDGFLINPTYASAVESGTIVFDGSNKSYDSTTNTLTAMGRTTNGYSLYCVITNAVNSPANKLVSVTNSSEIHFYDSGLENEFTFEKIEKISFSTDGSDFGFKLDYLTNDGEIKNGTYDPKSTNTRTISFGGTYGYPSNLSVVVTSADTNVLTSIILTYSCTPKVQTGVEISTAPTKTSYLPGEFFNPEGMVVKAVYGEQKIATKFYDYSPKRALTTDDTEVIISFGGFSISQPIIVSESTFSFDNGTYVSGNYKLVIGQESYYIYNDFYNKVSFVPTQTGNNVLFTFNQLGPDSGANENFNYERINIDINGTYQSSTTGVLINNNVVKLVLNKKTAFGSSSSKEVTFTKQ